MNIQIPLARTDLPAAPHVSAGPAPVRRPGSVRRTSSIDATWPEGRRGSVVFDGRARDIRTPAQGSPLEVLAQDRVRAVLSPDRTIREIRSEPPRANIERLIGARGGGKLRSALDDALPDEVAAGSPLSLLIDDFAGASLVLGWAWRRWPSADPSSAPDPALIAARVAKMEGICTGFAAGSTAVTDSTGTYQSFAPVEPLARVDDPAGWHDMPDAPGVTGRRARRIDLWREGDLICIDAMFQDSAAMPEGGRVAVHEYSLQLEANAATGLITRINAQPRVLPYQECPGAIANLDKILGLHLSSLRTAVIERLSGTLGCTHLNDALRSLAETPLLLTHLS